jgi:dephospho-CoA kinase
MAKETKFICISGMPGAGKTEATEYLMKKGQFGYLHFGEIVLEKIKSLGREPSENLEREIRESLRKEYGMAVMAILNEPKVNELLEKGTVFGDGLRSFEEYLFFRRKFGERFVVIAVFAPPLERYKRLGTRSLEHPDDKRDYYRSISFEEAVARDIAEIERLNLGGTLAMADYTVINSGDKTKLYAQLDEIYKQIEK